MNNPFNNPESVLEQGQSVVKKTAKVVGDQAKVTAQTATSQLTGQSFDVSANTSPSHTSDAHDKDFVKDLYGVKQSSPSNGSSTAKATGDDQSKLLEARKKLQALTQQHTESYYVPTFEQPKKEEAVVDKLEREDQEKKMEEYKAAEKKPKDIAVDRASKSAETFRGASG